MPVHTHENHPHEHGPGCGHTAIRHEGHVDYLHDGHLHHPRPKADQVEEHKLEVSDQHPDRCQPLDDPAHDPEHVHGPGCGHEPVPHGDHTDYLVGGRLHHPHDAHCDDHGPVEVVQSGEKKA